MKSDPSPDHLVALARHLQETLPVKHLDLSLTGCNQAGLFKLSYGIGDGRARLPVLVTEYAPGAGIGWHRDRPVFSVWVLVPLWARAAGYGAGRAAREMEHS
jgi:hypothetical protein